MKIFALAAVAGIALAGAPAMAQDDAAPPETKEVQKLADAWTAAYNAHNGAALGALYADDARLYMHGRPGLSGRQAIQRFWADDMKVDNPLTVLSVTDAVNGVDMKLVHGNYQVINRATGVPVGRGRFAHIWTRANGQWRLDRDLWNQPAE